MPKKNGSEKRSFLGKGQYGTVFLVHDDSSTYVIKEIQLSHMSPPEIEKSQLEAKTMNRLNHPNVIKFYSSRVTSKEGGILEISMEFASHGTLSDLLNKQQGSYLPEAKTANFFTQLCLSVQYIHSKNVLHRDLKPQNVLLTESSAGMLIKLTDFGISTVLSTRTKATTVLGTPSYLAPELINNKPYNEKCDIWALGCILFELFTLKRAFDGASFSEIFKNIQVAHLSCEIPNPDMPVGPYSSHIISLIKMILNTNDKTRPTSNTILAHPLLLYQFTQLRFFAGVLQPVQRSVPALDSTQSDFFNDPSVSTDVTATTPKQRFYQTNGGLRMASQEQQSEQPVKTSSVSLTMFALDGSDTTKTQELQLSDSNGSSRISTVFYRYGTLLFTLLSRSNLEDLSDVTLSFAHTSYSVESLIDLLSVDKTPLKDANMNEQAANVTTSSDDSSRNVSLLCLEFDGNITDVPDDHPALINNAPLGKAFLPMLSVNGQVASDVELYEAIASSRLPPLSKVVQCVISESHCLMVVDVEQHPHRALSPGRRSATITQRLLFGCGSTLFGELPMVVSKKGKMHTNGDVKNHKISAGIKAANRKSPNSSNETIPSQTIWIDELTQLEHPSVSFTSIDRVFVADMCSVLIIDANRLFVAGDNRDNRFCIDTGEDSFPSEVRQFQEVRMGSGIDSILDVCIGPTWMLVAYECDGEHRLMLSTEGHFNPLNLPLRHDDRDLTIHELHVVSPIKSLVVIDDDGELRFLVFNSHTEVFVEINTSGAPALADVRYPHSLHVVKNCLDNLIMLITQK